MATKSKLLKCTVKGCGAKYQASEGGTGGPKGRCPGHYAKLRRYVRGVSKTDPDLPLRSFGEGLVQVKFYVTRSGRELLASQATKAGLSLSAYCAGLVLAD